MAGTRWFTTLASLVGIAIPAAWLLSVVTPGEEAVKIRNGLVASVGLPDDFTWTPDQMPTAFLANEALFAPEYVEVATALAEGGAQRKLQGFELALALSRHLTGAPGKRLGNPVQGGLAKAYTGIAQQGRGNCADFTQVFSGLALAWGNSVFDHDQSAAVRRGARISSHTERALGILSGKRPEMRIYPRGLSHGDVDSLLRARNRFFTAVVALAVASVVLGGLLLVSWRPREARA